MFRPRTMPLLLATILVLTTHGSAAGQEAIDLKAIWPNPDMAREGYYLSGDNGFTWRFLNQAGDYDVWTLLGGSASDTYVWFHPESSVGAGIVVVMSAWRGGSRYNDTSPLFPRFVKLSDLPLRVEGRLRARVRLEAQSPTECPVGFAFVEEHGCTRADTAIVSLVLSIDGDRLRLDSSQASDSPYERLWAGYVPYCDAPHLKALGVIRYETNVTDPPIATELCWKR